MSERVFTTEELKQFDGKEGRPAYVAVDGVVYDATASRLWRNGAHVKLHSAGADLSEAILVAPHGKSRLENLPRVGSMAVVAAAVPSAPRIPWPAALAYRLHGHPASVHFPIALCVVASVLHVVGMLLECPDCETVALWNLLAGVASAPLTIGTGCLDWVYQYGARPTALFKWKIGLSGVFVALGIAAIAVRFLAGPQLMPAYDVMLVLFAPLVLALGLVGGRITFPS